MFVRCQQAASGEHCQELCYETGTGVPEWIGFIKIIGYEYIQL